MDESKCTQKFLSYVNSDDGAFDVIDVNKTLMRAVWDRAYRSGFAEGVASVNRIERNPEQAEAQ